MCVWGGSDEDDDIITVTAGVCVCVCVWTEESVCVNSDSGFTPPDVSAADACFILRQNGCRVTLDDLLTRAENQI